MKSKDLSRFKNLRCLNSMRKDIKFIKKFRIRKDRRVTRQILKTNPNIEILPGIICINSASWEIV